MTSPRPQGTSSAVLGAALGLAAVVAATAALVVSVGGDDEPGPAAAPRATDQPGQPVAAPPAASPPAATGPCTYAAGARPATKDVGLPPSTPVPVAGRNLVLDTTAGTVVVRLSEKAPCTTNSFVHLAQKRYFDGTSCHRLTTGGIFVLQCGDPGGDGSGGPGYSFTDENLEGATYPAGTVAMANSGPNTNGSQFFIVYDDTQLPPSYTPWGTVTEGLDAIRAVAAAGTDEDGDGPPNTPVTLTTVTVR